MNATHAARTWRSCLARAALCALLGTSVFAAPVLAQTSSKSSAKKSGTSATHRKGTNAAKAKGSLKADPSTALTGDPLKDQARQTSERDRLTARIAELHQQIAAGERTRSGAASALARAERALAEVNRRLDLLAQRQKATQDLVATLDRQRVGTEGQIVAGQADLSRTMTTLYANRDRDPLRTWLGGGDPNEAVLTDGYLEYVARAEIADVDALRARVSDLQSRRQRADEDNLALSQQAEAQKSAREALASDQAAQRQALERLSQKLAEQRNIASALEADEKRLSRVVEQLQKVIEQKASEERARRQAAKKRADEQAAARRNTSTPPSKTRETPPVRVEPEPDDAPGSGAFAQLRGQLRLPTRGAVTGRFGAPRGGSGATWKGLFVKTEPGAEVRAVAAGKVIYADDLRGFGNLLIVDHGNQYLSIYGNNDTLLKHTGDSVQAGDVVSRSGNSSGDDQTGLYFELRFRGRPFDPMPWIGSR
jgi:septal ring factor EnvC (AmiA/AmiB activator)